MRARFVNEISRAEDDWANAQIDKWLKSQEVSIHTEQRTELEKYVDNIVDDIWKRLRTKLSLEYLRRTGTNKKTVKENILMYDSPYNLYMNVRECWDENIPWDEAANFIFDEVYRAITSQYDGY